MSHFNLIDEPWIPVCMKYGGRKELGIWDTLRQAHNIASIEHNSPLVVAALHRLLLAILYRAFEGPTDGRQAQALFNDGLPLERIKVYLDRWRNRFWLFDDDAPFWQLPDYDPKEWRSWSALAVEHNADNAKVLFDHLMISQAGTISLVAAARWLVACQGFVVGGGNSDFKYTKGSPSASSLVVLPLGDTLSDTMLFSLVPQPRQITMGDLPAWERSPETVATMATGPTRAP